MEKETGKRQEKWKKGPANSKKWKKRLKRKKNGKGDRQKARKMEKRDQQKTRKMEKETGKKNMEHGIEFLYIVILCTS